MTGSCSQRVKEYGGTVFVQDPKAAEGPWMPNAAITATQTPLVMTLAEIAQALIGVAAQRQHLH